MTFAAATRIDQIQTMIGALAAPAPKGSDPIGATSFAKTLATARTPAVASDTPFGAEIDAAAARHGIDPALLRGLVRQESGFDPRARSAAGAMGLTQLMPATAASLGVTDPFDPEENVMGGAAYLRQQLDRFNGDERLALAAYNAGPGAVLRYNGVPPYQETMQYISRVLSSAGTGE